jgi:hypothetical protein
MSNEGVVLLFLFLWYMERFDIHTEKSHIFGNGYYLKQNTVANWISMN